MREETVAYLTQLGRRADLFGYSDGGIVALLTALARPDLVRRLVVVGANFHFSGLHPFETPGVPSEAFTSFSQEFARHNPAGSAAAADVFRGGFALCATSPALTAEQLSAVVAPTLVVTGDDDVVRLDHSVALYESLPAAQLFVVPGTSHAVLKERTRLVATETIRFLRAEFPAPTFAPIRRATPPSP
jgi:pimeloyl-ACP methyl ester carboxylesterase